MDSLRRHLKEYLLFYLLLQAALTLPGARLVLLSFRFDSAAQFTADDYYTIFTGVPYFFAIIMLPAIACVLKELERFGTLKQLFIKIGLVTLGGFLYIFFASKYSSLLSITAIIFSVGLVAFWAASYFTITPTGFLNTIAAKRTKSFNLKALLFTLLLMGSFTSIELVLGVLMPQPPEVKYSALEWAAKEKLFFEWKEKFSLVYASVVIILSFLWFFVYRLTVLRDMRELTKTR